VHGVKVAPSCLTLDICEDDDGKFQDRAEQMNRRMMRGIQRHKLALGRNNQGQQIAIIMIADLA
jgi:hypothetical protein